MSHIHGMPPCPAPVRYVLRGLLALGLAVLFLAPPLSLARARDDRDPDLEKSLKVLEEALAKVREHALKPPPPGYLVHQAIRSYLKRFDPYSDYLSPREYKAYLLARSPDYGGVGMDIAVDKSGRIVCRPFPGSPARAAGVASGDVLLAVDGRPVAGRSVFLVGTTIRGRIGTRVVLDLGDGERPQKRVVLNRAQVSYRTVEIVRPRTKPVIRIHGFTRETPGELRQALDRVGPGEPKIIDLRSNSGGDLEAAVECAGFFLSRGTKVLDLKTNQGVKPFVSRSPSPDLASRVILWQDQNTASAAEVMIAALTRNRRAISLGERSFGKGVAQRVVRMSDGSAMFITYALILPPDGTAYHPLGLDPTHPLEEATTRACLIQTARVLESGPKRMVVPTGPAD